MSLELIATIALLCQSSTLNIFHEPSTVCQKEYIRCVEPKIKARYEEAEKKNEYAFGAETLSLKECILEKK